MLIDFGEIGVLDLHILLLFLELVNRGILRDVPACLSGKLSGLITAVIRRGHILRVNNIIQIGEIKAVNLGSLGGDGVIFTQRIDLTQHGLGGSSAVTGQRMVMAGGDQLVDVDVPDAIQVSGNHHA